MAATPRFCAFVPFPATTLTLDSNSGGDQTATLPAGIYAAFGVNPAVCGVTSSSTTVQVAAGGTAYNAGDLVDVFDVSAGTLIVSGATVASSTATTVVIDSSVTTAVGDVLYLQGSLEGNLHAYLASTDTANSSDDVRVVLSSGSVSLYMATGSATVTLDAYTAAVLRTSTSIAITTTQTVQGERPVAGYFAPTKTIVEDLPRKRRPGNVYVADDGAFRKISVAQQVRHRLDVRYRGGPRETDWAEIHAWEDFLELVDQGYKFRLYRDTATTTAVYARKTNPFGWQEWHVESGGEFEPRNPVGGIYDNWVHRLDLIEVTT